MNDQDYSFNPPAQAEFKNMDEFIGSAGRSLDEVKEERPFTEQLPWEKENVRPKGRVGFNLRLLEPYHLKIQWLARENDISLSKLMESVLYPVIDKQVKKKLEEKGLI